jgi:hypothetical protein
MQFRFLGGIIGLGIASSIMESRLKSQLREIIAPEIIDSLLQSVEVLNEMSPILRDQVIEAFAGIYNLQDKVMIAFAAAQVFVVFLVQNNQWSKIG